MRDLRGAVLQALAFTMRDFATVRDFEAAKAKLRDSLRATMAQFEGNGNSPPFLTETAQHPDDAAPDLLAVLLEVVAEWDARHADEDHRSGYTLDTGGIAQARAAIARATGGQ